MLNFFLEPPWKHLPKLAIYFLVYKIAPDCWIFKVLLLIVIYGSYIQVIRLVLTQLEVDAKIRDAGHACQCNQYSIT